MTMKGKSVLERFFAKIKKTESCWLWESSLSGNGYGTFFSYENGNRRKPKHIVAHRLSWELFRGPIPEGFWVLHKCDVRACVNPDHLFLGTAKDNTRDMFKKERGYRFSPKHGPAHPKSKLSQEQAEQIRKLYASGNHTYRTLGKMFGVAHNSIQRIVLNASYKMP